MIVHEFNDTKKEYSIAVSTPLHSKINDDLIFTFN